MAGKGDEMKEAIEKRIRKLVEEEMKQNVNMELLDKLRQLASEDTMYLDLDAPARNALNTFFKEVKDVVFNELVAGSYGAQIVIDAIIVLAFEVGYKLRREMPFPASPSL